MDEKLANAISLFNSGKRLEAKKLLSEIINNDPNNSLAWYGMALCQEETDDKIQCLQRVIALDPNNAKAKAKLLELLNNKISTESFDESLSTANKRKGLDRKKKSKYLIISLGIGIGILIISFLVLLINPSVFPANRKSLSSLLQNPCNQKLLEEFMSTDILDLNMTIQQTSELWLDIGDSDLERKWKIQRKNNTGCIVTMQVEQNGEIFDYIQYFIYLDSGRVTVENEEARILIKAFCSTPEKWGCLDNVRIISLLDPSTLSSSSIMANIPTIPTNTEKKISPTPMVTPLVEVEKTTDSELASKYDIKVYSGMFEYDGFNQQDRWSEHTTDSYVSKYENGRFMIQTLIPSIYAQARPSDLSTRDFYISVDIQSANIVNEGDYAGIICGVSKNTWYGFFVEPNTARIVRVDGENQTNITTISDFTGFSNLFAPIDQESGSVRIGFVCNTEYFIGTINDVVVVEGKDENNQFGSRQPIGLVVGSNADNLVKFYFDNFSIQVKGQ